MISAAEMPGRKGMLSMDIEKVLELAAKTQEFAPDDELTKLVEEADDELSEDDLDLVSAASAAPDYGKFLNYMKTHPGDKR